MCQAESIQLVRDRRNAANQELGFASRPFVLCGLPVRCPPRSTLVYERRNGLFTRYYATALHELTRLTKPQHRLNRDFSAKRFGDHGYAREELVAELGTAFLCAEVGITPEVRDDHAAYPGHWLTVLKEDKRAIFSAAAHAQRAADYLGGRQAKEQSAAA